MFKITSPIIYQVLEKQVVLAEGAAAPGGVQQVGQTPPPPHHLKTRQQHTADNNRFTTPYNYRYYTMATCFIV